MTALNFPITAFHKNIIFTTQRKAFAMYKLKPAPHDFFPEDRQIRTQITSRQGINKPGKVKANLPSDKHR